MDMITKVASQSTTCPSSISQAGALAALEGSQDFVAEAVRSYAERSRFLAARIATIPGFRCEKPQGAFYLFPSVEGLLGRGVPGAFPLASDVDVAAFLLEAAGVAVVDGGAYGMPSFVRMSFATSLEQIEKGCMRISAACSQLQ
jgi:aspartate aminotransferase